MSFYFNSFLNNSNNFYNRNVVANLMFTVPDHLSQMISLEFLIRLLPKDPEKWDDQLLQLEFPKETIESFKQINLKNFNQSCRVFFDIVNYQHDGKNSL